MPKNYYSLEQKRLNLISQKHINDTLAKEREQIEKSERVYTIAMLIVSCLLLVIFT